MTIRTCCGRWSAICAGTTATVTRSTGAAASSLPIVVFPDGSFLGNPSTAEIARKLGLKTKAEFPFYDLVVVGAGPAGLAASVYAAADGLHTLLIEREAPGGQAGRSSRIENYLGFPMRSEERRVGKECRD